MTNPQASGLFQQSLEVRWSDCDANQHMRHSAYSDFCAHARLGLLEKIELTKAYMAEHKIGPVLFKEETEYKREAHLGELLTVVVEAVEPTEFSKSIQVTQHVYNSKGELAAVHRCVIAWMHLLKRKVVDLPEQVIAAMSSGSSSEAGA